MSKRQAWFVSYGGDLFTTGETKGAFLKSGGMSVLWVGVMLESGESRGRKTTGAEKHRSSAGADE